LINAALEGSPLWIRYKYRRWKDPEAIEYESFASCIYLSNSEPNREGTPRYRPSLTKPFIDMGAFTVGGAIYLNGYGINPYFNISASHILEVKVINCTKCYYNIEVYKNSLSELVLNPYNYPLNYKVKVDTLIAQKANFDIDNLLYKKLIAHYETIKGNTELALNYYLAVNYETMVKFDTEELKWGETCVKDINSYINLTKNLKHWSSSYELNPDTVLQNFMSVKGLLIESGWKWE
jgi:virulence-associated protein VapD